MKFINKIKETFKREVSEPINIFKGLYDYQLEAVKATEEEDKGVICIPTGAGKTYMEAAIIANDIVKNPDEFRMYVINAPRIMLSYQLLNELYSFLTLAGIKARYMFVHSGGKDDEKDRENIRRTSNATGNSIPYATIESGTSPIEITRMMMVAREQKLPLILISTYHSANRIEEPREALGLDISIALNDEAHYLVQERFYDILNTLTTKRCYFFTATRIHTPSDKGRGMNNVESYGEILYEMIPRQAIDKGKMVRPRIHIVRTKGVYNTEDYNRSLNKIIKDTFEQHEAYLTKQKAKILVSVKGTADMQRFLNSREYGVLRNNHVHIYAVSSVEDIGNDINGEKVRRGEFLRRLKEDGTNPNKKLIVLQYDILTEGIDVSGFTGIMPLRSLSKSKFMQTYGRTARLDAEDRKRIDSGEISPHDLNKMNKPYAYVLIPNIVHSNEDDKKNFTQLVNELRKYGFKPFENIISSTEINGIPEIEELDGLNEVVRRVPNFGQLIENLEAEIEAEADARLSDVDRIKNILGME